jgi:hypothetical protein
MVLNNVSAGRVTDGKDSDSNCTDFKVQPATVLSAASADGATNIKVASVADFAAGQTVMLDTGTNRETATIVLVGTAGATTVGTAVAAGDTVIPVASPAGFSVGQTIAIERESATIAAVGGGPGGARITLARPLTSAHAAGAALSGTGITLAGALAHAHPGGAQLLVSLPTPGAPNR